ncbi:hypothetical protein [uncultured Prevotella sp.]|uniref:hypothetical protein n=1 Tax=uncultured Prevotella sp. TaxID=159272 RepID=UPI0026112E8D|nr:hypothetical protein [uncultured Prevotella sp.]
MKRFLILTAIPFLAASLFFSCKQKNSDMEQLQSFVEKINEQPNRDMENGTVLLKCEYKQGDSLLTYRIKVNDSRFSNAPADSVKSTLTKKLAAPGMQKLVKLLSRNSIGLQYIYEMEDNDMTIVFTPSELSSQNNQ